LRFATNAIAPVIDRPDPRSQQSRTDDPPRGRSSDPPGGGPRPPGSSTFVARSPAVKGAASRLASLGPDGPPLTAGPLRLDGNEGPLTRTSSETTTRRRTDAFGQLEYPPSASYGRPGREPGMSAAMILRVHVPGAHDHEIGDEIWQVSLADAIDAEADTIAGNAGAELLAATDQAHRDILRDRIVADMTSTLVSVGDRYQAPDGVIYTLADDCVVDPLATQGRLAVVSPRASEPVVEEVLRFEDLPLGSAGTRRTVVRWSDGSESPAMAWYPDEMLVCEGDLIGKSHDEIRSLHSAGIATGFSRRRRIARRDLAKPSPRGSSRLGSHGRLRRDFSRPKVLGVVPRTGARRAVRRVAAIE
jgi:hypothetical protein